MMSGKVVSRAVRGHTLVDATLNTTLLADAYNLPLPTKDTLEQPPVEMTPAADTEPDEEVSDNQETVTTDLSIASELYDQFMPFNMPMEELCCTQQQEGKNAYEDSIALVAVHGYD